MEPNHQRHNPRRLGGDGPAADWRGVRVTVWKLKRRRAVRTGGRLAWWADDVAKTEAPVVGTHRQAVGVACG
ncbi:hypothetical protein Fuma_06011 [Fuerstiella marisgermanici]|uniref:Uncharacterized protein n=1 Tax=Fuerstiella marisgermanici TaxID=1891926 RepID=A0A1P8WQL1_9PLAN|nr:hypothetical protein Fuma_06011 [Fuerstiella marisgermanici]